MWQIAAVWAAVMLAADALRRMSFMSTVSRSPSVFQLWMSNSFAPTFSDGGVEKSSGFDLDFAEAMSKPLPEWYKEQKRQQEALLKEAEENRERILREFKAKYDLSELQKRATREAKWAQFDQRRAEVPWYMKALGLGGKKGGEGEDAEEASAREKWSISQKKFWDEEQKDTGFYLPGFFEVFPELQLKWPKWAKNRQGKVTKCKVNDDCPFPEACCPHPILPGDKFCCTGFGNRMLVPKYQAQEAYVRRDAVDVPGAGGKRDERDDQPWRPRDDSTYYFY